MHDVKTAQVARRNYKTIPTRLTAFSVHFLVLSCVMRRGRHAVNTDRRSWICQERICGLLLPPLLRRCGNVTRFGSEIRFPGTAATNDRKGAVTLIEDRAPATIRHVVGTLWSVASRLMAPMTRLRVGMVPRALPETGRFGN